MALSGQGDHFEVPLLLQIEEKVMTLSTKGAPLHLGHFSSAPARAHRAQTAHHKKLQMMRYNSGKRKTAAAAVVTATAAALTHPASAPVPTAHVANAAEATGGRLSNSSGSSSGGSPARHHKAQQSAAGFMYPLQTASPSLFAV
jgi:hypothetical protein